MRGDGRGRRQPAGCGHREIDHTADLGFELWAEALPDLYAEGVLALAGLCYDRGAVRAAETRRCVVHGESREELLVRWLQEVYLVLETDMWLTTAAADVVVESGRVAGVLHGESFDPERHTIHTEIKAITYHDLRVQCDGGVWRATVVVDV